MNKNSLEKAIVVLVASMMNLTAHGQISNDECSAAVSVFDGAPAFTGENLSASILDSVEASCAPTSNYDVWFEYVASCTGQATIDTFESGGHDTVLSIYDTCGGSEIVCNDDFGGLESQVTFSTSQGASYFVRLASIGAGCPYVLNIACTGIPTNDECAAATMITDGVPAVEGNNSQADTADDNEASCQPNSGGDVWFEYVATCTGQATVDSFGSGQEDTVLSVYDTCDGEEIACNDDFGSLMSQVTFDCSAGQSYSLRLASYEAPGDYDLNIACIGQPGDNACVVGTNDGDGDNDGDVDVADYTRFATCFAGPEVGLQSGCECFDFDDDEDVDLIDMMNFQSSFIGL